MSGFIEGHFAEDWWPEDGVIALVEGIERQGYKIKKRPDFLKNWCRAMAAPWKVIYVPDPANIAEDDAPLIAHEGTHAHQMTDYLLGGWIWGLFYLLFPWFRRKREFQAEIYETAIRARQAGAGITKGALRAHVKAKSLGGWRKPHFTGGDQELLHDGVAEMAMVLNTQWKERLDGTRPDL